MEFRATRPPTASHKTGAFVLFRPEGSRDLGRLPVPDAALRKLAAAAWKTKEFGGKRGQLVALHGGGADAACCWSVLGRAKRWIAK